MTFHNGDGLTIALTRGHRELAGEPLLRPHPRPASSNGRSEGRIGTQEWETPSFQYPMPIPIGLQSYLLRFGGTGVGARRVQSYLLRRYDWRCRDIAMVLTEQPHKCQSPVTTTVYEDFTPVTSQDLRSIVTGRARTSLVTSNEGRAS